jgi:hypothetical protein
MASSKRFSEKSLFPFVFENKTYDLEKNEQSRVTGL